MAGVKADFGFRDIDRGWKHIEKLAKTLSDKDAFAKAGIIGTDASEAVEGAGSEFTAARLAAVHEFGATINHPGGTPYAIGPGGRAVFLPKGAAGAVGITGLHTIEIPERSFIRSTFNEQRAKYEGMLQKLVGAIYDQRMTVQRALGLLGVQMASDQREKIRSGLKPELAASTLRRKRKAGAWNDGETAARDPKPLIETGTNLLNRISHEVVTDPSQGGGGIAGG